MTRAIVKTVWYSFVDAFGFVVAFFTGDPFPRIDLDYRRFMRVSLVKPAWLVWERQCKIMRSDLTTTKEIEVIPAKDNGGIAILVHTPAVSLIKRVRVSLRKRVSLVRTTPRLVRDILGAWDPSAVDWSEPAIYQEVSMDRMASWGRLVHPDDRYAIAAGIADLVMCGEPA